MPRRAGLSPAAVVEAAAALADADGLDALTLASVAGAVGVRTPSLYTHVASLDDLRRRIALLALREIDQAMRAAVMGRFRGDALVELALAYRRYAVAHPGRYAATVRAPDPADAELAAAGASAVEPLLAVLRGFDFHGDAAIHAARTVRSALHGFVSLETGGGFGVPLDLDASFRGLLGVLASGLSASAAAADEFGGQGDARDRDPR